MASIRLHSLYKEFFLLLVLFSFIQTCCGFNLDVRFPVIKQGKTKGSFFGLSVALHNQTEGSKRYLLLTGAPKEKAMPGLNVNETGAVYFCPITTDTSDCSRMDLITSTNPTEMVEGMWLGVTVASQRSQLRGRVLACGHRYAKVLSGTDNDQLSMIGKCYVRGNDFTYDSGDEWQAHGYEDCNPSGYLENEVMCNLGIAAGMTDTDVYIGSPGSFLWQGDVHLTWWNPKDSWDYISKSFGNLRNHYSYMGYSILEEKNVLSKEVTVVTGSPRYKEKGSITLARSGSERKLITERILIGEQVGSYFGNSIAVTDLNNDDWKDLIVGAPFYFDRKTEVGGRVYVFMNENGSFRDQASMVLSGQTTSAFGMAVAAIGDINQDGFQDFAVGAPFQDSGKVYIWLGSDQPNFQKPSQVIEGHEVNKGGFHTFGYSISGGMDMDDNSYPDVLVGSLDDHIALLRARPVIHLDKTFSVSPPIVNTSTCSPGDKPCVTVKVCFSYTLSNGNKDFKTNITVQYVVTTDWGRRSARLRFLANKQDTYTGYLSMPSSKCQVLDLSLVDPVRDKLSPVVFLLNVSLYEETPKAQRSLQNLDVFPVISEKQSLSEKAEINFQKACGLDNECTSNLQLTAEFADEQHSTFPSLGKKQVMQYNTSVKKLMLMVHVTNKPAPGKLAEDAHQAMLNITCTDSLGYSGVRAVDGTPLSDIQCHLNGTLLCELGNPFSGGKAASFYIIFETSGISLDTREIDCQLQLSTISDQKDLYPVSVVLMVEYTIEASFYLTPTLIETYFSGKVMGESAMKSTGDVGSLVEYRLQVAILKESLGTLGTLVVDFYWPFEVANGKWLLYISEILTKGTSESHCVPPGDVVNPLNLTLSDEGRGRKKRDTDEIEADKARPQAAITLQTPHKKMIVLDCEHGTARCVKFSCLLHNMSESAELAVRARVWNSTMLEDYSKAFRVHVVGRATLRLMSHIPTIKMNNQSREFNLFIEPVVTEENSFEAPLWIIILAVVAGVLLLGFIVLIMWKCGFFKRASRREMYEAKAQKAEMKIQPSETERLTEKC